MTKAVDTTTSAAYPSAAAGSSVLTSFDTQHEEMIHDAQLDYYGKKLATCSSDRMVRIHAVEGSTHSLIETLKGHQGPVWEVAWAHPKFGTLLASCSYDGKVLVWKEEQSVWSIVYEHSLHTASVNSVAFAPHEFGLLLACGSSDGRVSVVEYKDEKWNVCGDFLAHNIGCNSVSFNSVTAFTLAPPQHVTQPGQQQQQSNQLKLATGGSDNLVKVWFMDIEGNWQLESTLEGHSDWVRDVKWAPNVGLSSQTIASCSQDKTCILWVQQAGSTKWEKKLLKAEKFPEALWRVSWSLAGNLLAVSGGDNKVYLFKQKLDGSWEQQSELEEPSNYQHQ